MEILNVYENIKQYRDGTGLDNSLSSSVDTLIEHDNSEIVSIIIFLIKNHNHYQILVKQKQRST